jgi:hypothetical protein
MFSTSGSAPQTTQLAARGRTFVYGLVEGGAEWAYVEVKPGRPVLIHTLPNRGEGRLRAHLKSLVDGRAERRAKRARRNHRLRQERFQCMVRAIVRKMGSHLVSVGELRGYLACLSRQEQAEWVKSHMPANTRREWMRKFGLTW